MTKRLAHLAVAAVGIAGVLSVAATAQAGECPAGQSRPDARATGETMPKDVTDTVLGAVDLAGEIPGGEGRQLRLRRLVIQPGGVVPWHSHADRPALIMTLSGTITEYRSTCAVGIEHQAGDVSREEGGLSHWWRNNGKTPAVLIAGDVFHETTPAADDQM